jgi:hypothetical protein
VALDGGLLLAERRHGQATADAAALAGAAMLFSNYATNAGADTGGAAASAVTAAANANGYDGTNSTITCHIPPTTGDHVGAAGYVEVIVTYNQPRFFSSLWGTSNIPVSARAVARGQWVASSPGILVLDPTASGALKATGNGNITATNGNIIVNSNSSAAIDVAGNNSLVSDTNRPIDVAGNPGYSGAGSVTPTPTPLQTPTADPLRLIPEPGLPAAAPAPTTANGVTTYSPGYYPSGLSLTGGYNAVFQSGIYYMGGAFTVNGNNSSQLSGSGVMVFAGPSGSLNVGGNGIVDLSPPTSGTYTGISFFQSRSNSTDAQVAGNGKFDVTGTIYVPDALLKIAGNGDTSLASEIIAKQLDNVGGGNSGQVNVVYNANSVGKTRLLQLVE